MASKTPRSDELREWLARQRWFAGKARRIVELEVEDRVALAGGAVTILRVRLDNGAVDRYAATLAAGGEIAEALDDPDFCRALLDLIARDGRAEGGGGALVGRSTRAFPRDLPAGTPARRLGAEQSNTSVVFGDALILKQLRRVTIGVNPELEIPRFLTERTTFRHSPRLAGWLEYRTPGGETATVGVLQEMVAGAQDGWRWMLAALGRFYESVRRDASVDRRTLTTAAAESLAALRCLGQRTAELHLALASDPSVPAFAPERITAADVAAWSLQIEGQIAAARQALAPRRLPELAGATGGLAALVGVDRIRHHGDYHLGQTLRVESSDDWVIIDFEGEPLRPLAERRAKHAAVRDVAGMLRSIDYAAVSARARPGQAGIDAGDDGTLAAWGGVWKEAARREFLDAYRIAARGASFVPPADERFRQAVAVFELEKAAYEIVYEAGHRPEWIEIPARGLLEAAARLGPNGCQEIKA